MPTFEPGATRRIASAAQPCERSMWCAAASASSGFERPGACSPDPYPSHAATHGSLWVIQWETRSPSRSATASA